MAAVRIRGLGKTYRLPTGQSKPALHDVNLEIPDGEFVCILGPSGCGKSTLLNVLSGLDRECEGSIEFTGRSGATSEPGAVAIGYMFQDCRLLPWLTVRENIRFVLDGDHSSPEATQRIETWLARVGLPGHGSHYPAQLSIGMQQRVAVARALIIGPELLLLDEPFSSVDELTGLRMRQELLELWAEQRCTVVFVTHNPLEAVHLADRVLLMSTSPGRIREEIRIDPSLRRPRDIEDQRLWEISRHVVHKLMDMEEA